MPTPALLAVYAGLIVLASIAGGLVPLLVRLTHQRMQFALSFVAGAMLGVGLLHLIPHAAIELRSVDRVAAWTLAGFLTMFFIERFFAYHHHDISEDAEQDAAECDLHDDHGHTAHPPVNQHLTWSGAAVGLALHGLADGVALAASVEAEAGGSHVLSLAGLGTFLVIFLHKPFDAMTLGTLLAAKGRTPRARHLVNLLFALLVPGGAALFATGIGAPGNAGAQWLGIGLAFSAGTFLCIASSDLLPELQFHRHDRVKLSIALVLGIAAAWAIGLAEGSHHGRVGHEHAHPHAEAHGHDE